MAPRASSPQWAGLGLVLGLGASCGTLLPDSQLGSGTTDGTSSAGASTTTSGVDDTSTGGPDAEGSGGSSATTGTTGATDTTGTTGTMPQCGDGVPVPGEACHDAVVLDFKDDWCDIEFGDVAGDDSTDLVALRCPAAEVVTVFGSPGGLTGPGSSLETILTDGLAPGVEVSDIALGDVLVDGRIDVVAPNDTGLAIFYNFNGTFNSSELVGSAVAFSHVESGLIDGDGLADIVAVAPNTVQVLASEGGGPVEEVFDPNLMNPFEMHVVDGDGDDELDLLLMRSVGALPAAHLHRGTSTGFDTMSQDAFGPSVAPMAHGDVDGDGDLDLIATGGADDQTDTLWAFIYDGDTGYMPMALGSPPIPTVIHMALADLDDDGLDDLITVHVGGAKDVTIGTLRLARNMGDGAGFEETQTFDLPGYGLRVGVAELNGDDVSDVVVVTDGARLVQLLSNP